MNELAKSKQVESGRLGSSRLIVLIMLGLLLWTGILAWGAYLYGYRTDLRKPLVVGMVMLVFLSSWGTLLWGRMRRRQPRTP